MKNLFFGLSLLGAVFFSSNSNAIAQSYDYGECEHVYTFRYNQAVAGGVDHAMAKRSAQLFYDLCMMD